MEIAFQLKQTSIRQQADTGSRGLQNTELRFDLVGPVDELAAQVEKEFDFVREAEVMDTIAGNLQARTETRCCMP